MKRPFVRGLLVSLLAIVPVVVAAVTVTITVPPGAVWLAYEGYSGCFNGSDMVYSYDGEAGGYTVTPGQLVTIDVGDNYAVGFQFQDGAGANVQAGNEYGDVNNPMMCGE